MDRQILVLGGGATGALAANRLRCYCDSPDVRVLVVDRADTRDPETELLAALGLYGAHALRPPQHLSLRDGIGFRHVEAETVDLERAEVCLADGTTVPYDILVVATGAPSLSGCVTRSPGLGDGRGLVTVHQLSRRSHAHPRVYAIGAAADGHRPTSQVLHAQAEKLARSVREHLAADPPPPRGTTTVTAAANP